MFWEAGAGGIAPQDSVRSTASDELLFGINFDFHLVKIGLGLQDDWADPLMSSLPLRVER